VCRSVRLPLAVAAGAVAVLTGTVVTPAPASAIINGTYDADAHPNVAGLVSPTQYSDGTWLYCSGTLISPTVVVTAAHCAEDGEDVAVTFDPDYVAGDRTYAGTFEADPSYGRKQSDPHDLAVIVLDEAVEGITPAVLPAAGSLDALSSGRKLTSVGYGAYDVTKGKGGHGFAYDDRRMVAVGTLNAVTPSWLRVSMNASRGDGGTCYGDSGGPNFLGTSNVLAATTITGDAVCRATNVDYRLDTASARAFLGGYVTLP